MNYDEKISYLSDCILSNHNYFIIEKIEQYINTCVKVLHGEMEEGYAVEMFESLSRLALAFNKDFTAADLLMWYHEFFK